jgi:hypothetical protein
VLGVPSLDLLLPRPLFNAAAVAPIVGDTTVTGTAAGNSKDGGDALVTAPELPVFTFVQDLPRGGGGGGFGTGSEILP